PDYRTLLLPYTTLFRSLQANTKVLYIESPGSLLMQMLDVPRLVEWAHAHDLIVMTDNTWGSGYSYQPLALGVDVSIVAGTKYVGDRKSTRLNSSHVSIS